MFRPHVAAANRLGTWSSPFSQAKDAEFRKDLPDELVDRTFAVIFAAFAPETQQTYGAGLLRFHQFCDRYELPETSRMPASHLLLAAFISDHVATVGGDCVKGWMSGLKAWHEVCGAPWYGEDRWVKLARRTANKEGASFKKDQRAPVTVQHLFALHSRLNLSDPFDAAVWAVAVIAFWACRRLGELTIPSINAFDVTYHVTRAVPVRRFNPARGVSSLNIPLPWSKSTKEKGAMMSLTARDDRLCPIKAFDNHFLVNKSVPGDAPLFAFAAGSEQWSPITKPWFMARCTGIWKDANLLTVAGHSFRIGGSTELLLAGVPCEVVATIGGWTSLAFLLYWRKIEHIIPMNVAKAYDKKKVEEMAKAFEEFRIANNIVLHLADSL